MDSIVEENGNSSNVDDGHQSTQQQQQQQQQQQPHSHSHPQSSSGGIIAPPPAPISSAASVLTTSPNAVQYLHNPVHGLQVQSVIQAANQSSVIQTAATNAQSGLMPKGGVLYVGKPNATVIHTTAGSAVQIKPEPNTQHLDTNSDDSLTDDDSPRRRQDLTRRPSYHKIFTEISVPDVTAGTPLQMPESGGIPTISSTGGSATGTLIHLPQDSASSFYIPSSRIAYNTNNSVVPEDQTRKREIRLQKNREAARECRRKKKEYIKCLENRVAVLENQNKALIEELKSLKELYCQTKND